ncbi:MAG: hypothetical protein GY832_08345 [Chloroflexi bacterium]|nr:hypothetical protein [Chloroflexota bacterium]
MWQSVAQGSLPGLLTGRKRCHPRDRPSVSAVVSDGAGARIITHKPPITATRPTRQQRLPPRLWPQTTILTDPSQHPHRQVPPPRIPPPRPKGTRQCTTWGRPGGDDEGADWSRVGGRGDGAGQANRSRGNLWTHSHIGGPLSHGSIVAREYGIPAIIGPGVATKRIRSGQIITVDDDAGLIKLANGSF